MRIKLAVFSPSSSSFFRAFYSGPSLFILQNNFVFFLFLCFLKTHHTHTQLFLRMSSSFFQITLENCIIWLWLQSHYIYSNYAHQLYLNIVTDNCWHFYQLELHVKRSASNEIRNWVFTLYWIKISHAAETNQIYITLNYC